MQYLLFSMERTSEVYLSLLERIEVGKGVVDKVCRQPHCDDGSAATTGSCRAVAATTTAMPVGTL